MDVFVRRMEPSDIWRVAASLSEFEGFGNGGSSGRTESRLVTLLDDTTGGDPLVLMAFDGDDAGEFLGTAFLKKLVVFTTTGLSTIGLVGMWPLDDMSMPDQVGLAEALTTEVAEYASGRRGSAWLCRQLMELSDLTVAF